MKEVITLLILMTGLNVAARDCNLNLLKTYLPNDGSRAICDSEQNLPASFAGNIGTLSKDLKGLGYKTKFFDQCKNSMSSQKTGLSLVSQLGDCTQLGLSMRCSLYVGLIDNSNDEVLFENIVTRTGFLGPTLFLSEAIADMPSCSEL